MKFVQYDLFLCGSMSLQSDYFLRYNLFLTHSSDVVLYILLNYIVQLYRESNIQKQIRCLMRVWVR
jgi:hypothetical protein